jgi:hypothetical protein
MKKMMKANRDENVLIKEISKYNVHVRLEKIAVDPRDPAHPVKSYKIAVFSPAEFEKMEANTGGNHPINWVRVSGFDSAYVVHDGRLLPPEEKIEKSEVEKTIDVEVKKALIKAKRTATAVKNFTRAKPSDG